MSKIKKPNIPTTDKKNNSVILHSYKTISGPIPPPEYLDYYEKICKGAAERILKMAEENSKAAIELENKKLEFLQDENNKNFKLKSYGQSISFIFIILIVLLCGYACYKNSNMAAIASVVIALGIFVLAFLYGKNNIHFSQSD